MFICCAVLIHCINKYSQSLFTHFPIHIWTFSLFPIYHYSNNASFSPKCLYHFTFTQVICANSYFTISLSILGIVKIVLFLPIF